MELKTLTPLRDTCSAEVMQIKSMIEIEKERKVRTERWKTYRENKDGVLISYFLSFFILPVICMMCVLFISSSHKWIYLPIPWISFWTFQVVVSLYQDKQNLQNFSPIWQWMKLPTWIYVIVEFPVWIGRREIILKRCVEEIKKPEGIDDQRIPEFVYFFERIEEHDHLIELINKLVEFDTLPKPLEETIQKLLVEEQFLIHWRNHLEEGLIQRNIGWQHTPLKLQNIEELVQAIEKIE